MHPVKSGADRRAFGRRATNDHAIVRIPGRPPVRCMVKNISVGGALLDFGEAVWLPYTFHIRWEGTGREELCEIKHQNGGRIGVQFMEKAAKREDSALLKADEVSPWIAENAHPHLQPRR
jgi:hypothetical protein